MGTRFMTVCSVCNAPQIKTPSGPTCVNGHGGADGVLKTFSVPMTKQERQWVDRNAPRCACGRTLNLERAMTGTSQCSRCEQEAEAQEEAARTVTVSRDDLDLVLADAMSTYANSIDTPDYAVRIAVELKE